MSPEEKRKVVVDALARRYPHLQGSLGDPMALMQAATAGAQAASRRSPDADFMANGGYNQVAAQEALRQLYGMPNFIPPGFQRWNDQTNQFEGSPYQQNMLPNPRMAR